MGYFENLLIQEFGPRCESLDLDDFPEENISWNERCVVCKLWEMLDGYVEEKRREFDGSS